MMEQRKVLTTHRHSWLKKTSSQAMVGPAKDKHQAPTDQLKLYVRTVTVSEA